MKIIKICILFLLVTFLCFGEKYSSTVNAPDEYGNTPLSTAVSNYNVDMIKLLLNNKMDPNTNIDNYTGYNLLMWACYNNEVDLVKLLIKKGADVNAKDANGNSILSYTGNTNLLLLLLNNGLNPNTTDADGNNVLMIAIANNNLPLIKLSISKGANLVTENNYKLSALEIAINYNNGAVINLLVNEGINPDTIISGEEGYSRPLIMWAFENEDYELVKALIEKNATLEGTKFNAVDTVLYLKNIELLKLMLGKNVKLDSLRESINGETILLWALKNNYTDIAQLAIEKGANIKIGNAGNKPINFLISSAKIDLIKLAIEKGFDVNSFIDDNNTDTLLSWAVTNENVDFVTYLLSKNADVNKVYKNGWTVLMSAAQRNNSEIVKMLLEADADKNIKNNEGHNALYYASNKEIKKMLGTNYTSTIIGAVIGLLALIGLIFGIKNYKKNSINIIDALKNGDTEKAHNLILKNKKIDVKDSLGQNAFFHILDDKHKDFINMLKDKGLDFDTKNIEGNTPLLNALEKGKNTLALEYINLGAQVNTSNNSGLDAIALSILNNCREVAEKLKNMGISLENKYNEGKTLLHLASEADNLIAVKYLLNNEVNVNSEDINGKTPLSYAKTRDIEEVLKAQGGKY